MPSPKNINDLTLRLRAFAQAFVISVFFLAFVFYLLIQLCWLFNYQLILEPFIYYSAAIIAIAVAMVFAWSQSFKDL